MQSQTPQPGHTGPAGSPRPGSLALSLLTMPFSERLAALRKERGLTQQALAELAGVHTIQIHRYESAASQPSLEAIKRLAVALHVSTDALLFEESERGPDEELRLQFEAIGQFDAEEKKIVRALLDSLILKHQARRWASAS